MPDETEEHPDPFYDPGRRLEMFFRLIREGLIADKPPEQITEADFNLVDGRLLLEDIACADSVSVALMIDDWERELETAKSFDTVEELMAWLHDDLAPKRGLG